MIDQEFPVRGAQEDLLHWQRVDAEAIRSAHARTSLPADSITDDCLTDPYFYRN